MSTWVRVEMAAVQITRAGAADLADVGELYAQAGYGGTIDRSDTILPTFLAQRLSAYLAKGQQVLAMRRAAAVA
jgi:hypothetical protein